jgi:hypothetical protein
MDFDKTFLLGRYPSLLREFAPAYVPTSVCICGSSFSLVFIRVNSRLILGPRAASGEP